MPYFPRTTALGAVIIAACLLGPAPSASLATTRAALLQSSRAPTVGEKRAIERTVLTLARALNHRRYRLACNQYTPAVRALFVLTAQRVLRQPSVHACAQALAVIAKHQKFKAIPRPHFKRIRISGKVATVTIDETAASGRTMQGTATLMRGSHGWKVVLRFIRWECPIFCVGMNARKEFHANDHRQEERVP